MPNLTWRFWARGLALTAAATLAACAPPRLQYTVEDAGVASIGIAGARTWADAPAHDFETRTKQAIRLASARNREPTYLALSGGGGDGAYGAGVLNGWTQSGRRPVFTIVSGVSTGALMAPFAFLGPRYDEALRELYTSGVAETLLSSPEPLKLVFGTSAFSSDRLKALVSRYVTPDLVGEIGREAESGRLLFVLTTDIDAQRPVLWNMTEIARQGTPRSLDLFRDVLVASASIPAVFPPVLIDVGGNGKGFREMHVDGSVSANAYTLPAAFLTGGSSNRQLVRGGKIFLVLNTSPLPAFSVTENKTTSIVGRTVAMSFKGQNRADLKETYEAARRYGFDFNLTYIDPVDPNASEIGFDTEHMRRLFARGESIGQTGSFWMKAPPPDGTVARLEAEPGKPPGMFPGL